MYSNPRDPCIVTHAMVYAWQASGITMLTVRRVDDPPTLTLGHDTPATMTLAVGDWRWVHVPMICDEVDGGAPLPGCLPAAQLGVLLEGRRLFTRPTTLPHARPPPCAHARPAASWRHGERLAAGVLRWDRPRPSRAATRRLLEARRRARGQWLPPAPCRRPLHVPHRRQRLLRWLQRARHTRGLAARHLRRGQRRGRVATRQLHRDGARGVLSAAHPARLLGAPAAAHRAGRNGRFRARDATGGARRRGHPQVHAALDEGWLVRPARPAHPSNARAPFPAPSQLANAHARSPRPHSLAPDGRGLVPRPVSAGATAASVDGALPFPNNDTFGFGGAMLVNREDCPRVGEGAGVGYRPGYLVDLARPAGGSAALASNTSLEFFCTDEPGWYILLLDAQVGAPPPSRHLTLAGYTPACACSPTLYAPLDA